MNICLAAILQLQSADAAAPPPPTQAQLRLLEPIPYEHEGLNYSGRVVFYDANSRWVAWDFEAGTDYSQNADFGATPGVELITGGNCGSGPRCLGLTTTSGGVKGGRNRYWNGIVWRNGPLTSIFNPQLSLTELTFSSTNDLYIYPYSNSDQEYAVRTAYALNAENTVKAKQRVIAQKIVVVTPPTPLPEAKLAFPFSRRNDWEICRGYNLDGTSHGGFGKYSLDLAYGLGHTSGNSGCSRKPEASSRKLILSPGDGIVEREMKVQFDPTRPQTRFADLLCIKLDRPVNTGLGSTQIKSVQVGHINSDEDSERAAVGSKVEKGDVLGEACRPGECASEGDYAHAHIRGYLDERCLTDTPVAFGNAFKGESFGSDGSVNQWRRTVIEGMVSIDAVISILLGN